MQTAVQHVTICWATAHFLLFLLVTAMCFSRAGYKHNTNSATVNIIPRCRSRRATSINLADGFWHQLGGLNRLVDLLMTWKILNRLYRLARLLFSATTTIDMTWLLIVCTVDLVDLTWPSDDCLGRPTQLTIRCSAHTGLPIKCQDKNQDFSEPMPKNQDFSITSVVEQLCWQQNNTP